MKTLGILVFALGLAAWPSTAFATCSSQTYIINGRVTVCSVCCFSGGCTTVCS